MKLLSTELLISCDSINVMIMQKKEKVEKRLTIPPKANMALYWSKVWLKMQKKGITPATKNLARRLKRMSRI